jgi:hypothetical protein
MTLTQHDSFHSCQAQNTTNLHGRAFPRPGPCRPSRLRTTNWWRRGEKARGFPSADVVNDACLGNINAGLVRQSSHSLPGSGPELLSV